MPQRRRPPTRTAKRAPSPATPVGAGCRELEQERQNIVRTSRGDSAREDHFREVRRMSGGSATSRTSKERLERRPAWVRIPHFDPSAPERALQSALRTPSRP